MTLKSKLIAALAAPAAVLALALPALAQGQANTVFINGKVFTADSRSSVVQAFAVRGDRFVAVGDEASVRQAAPAARVVDLKGRFVMPGLTDNHFHHQGGGAGVDLSRVRTMAELLEAVRKAAAATPANGLVISNSDWHEAQLKEQRLPTTADVDKVAPNRAVVLVRGGHSIFLNSMALRRWNISKATPVPAGGAIVRDQRGELTGELVDNAKNLVDLPPEPPLTLNDILDTQKALHPYGITAVRIPGGYKGDLLQAWRLMKQARDSGQLSLRYTVYLPGFALTSAQGVRDLVGKWNVVLDEGDDWVRIGGVKLMVDGGFEGGHMTRPFAEPYGRGGTYKGLEVIAPGPYQVVVDEFNRMGWRVTTHAVGDAGIDQVLAAYEKTHAQHPITGRRWSIEHAFVARPDQLPRIGKLEIGMSVQDHLYLAGPSLKRYLGMERAGTITPMRSYLDAGLLVSGGTDAPVIPVNPFWAIFHFLSRETISDGVYGPAERVASRPELLKVFTANYAQMIGESDRKGSIEPGKYADFAVLTEDLLTAQPERVRDAMALATYVGGREVYRDPRF